MKSKVMIDKQRIMNIASAIKLISYKEDLYLEDHKITDKEKIAGICYLVASICNEISINTLDNLENALKNKSEVEGWIELGVNAGHEVEVKRNEL